MKNILLKNCKNLQRFHVFWESLEGVLDIWFLNDSIFTSFYHWCLVGSDGNPDAKRLYDDLLSDYNKLVRPVKNVTDAVTVQFKLKLSQLIDVVNYCWIMKLKGSIHEFWKGVEDWTELKLPSKMYLLKYREQCPLKTLITIFMFECYL